MIKPHRHRVIKRDEPPDEKNGKEIGENAGMTMMLPMLVNAMEVCKVKMDEL